MGFDMDIYITALKNALERSSLIYEQLENGDFSSVVCDMSGQYDYGGEYDINGLERTRLAYYMMMLPAEDISADMLERLMREEISARKQDSYQGVGDALRIFTALLRRYGKGEYQSLFDEARSANSDCECGYAPENCDNILKERIDDYPPESCISALDYLGFDDEAAELSKLYADKSADNNIENLYKAEE